jgi:hypothetical protein
MKSEVPSKGLEWANLLLGSGLALAAFAFAGQSVVAWNAGIVGVLIACCSAVALYRFGTWTEWSNIILGSWAVISPFALGFAEMQGPTWTHIAIGASVAVIATIQLVAGRKPGASTTA